MNLAIPGKKQRLPVFTIAWILTSIGVVVAGRRAMILTGLATTPRLPNGSVMDDPFSQHPLLTWLHILAGTLFLVLGPLQFSSSLKKDRASFHRLNGRLFVAAGMVTGITALIMNFQFSLIGGLNEAAATVFFGTLFLTCLALGLVRAFSRNFSAHREWMIRGYSIGLAIATIRPIMALFFIFSGRPIAEFFGTAFWIGFTLHLVIAEVYIRQTDKTERLKRYI